MKTYLSKQPEQQGFSLVELSIVLVILGLLVGGILSGQSLIRASELRSVTTEYQTFVTSLGTFRDRYFALPGDLSNAASFWSTSHNGDGDGAIEGSTTANSNETGLAWEHMSKATIIEGSYTPTSWAATVRGSSNPKAKLNLAAWHIWSVGTQANTSLVFYEGNYGNALIIMSGTDLSDPSGAVGVLKSEEAWNIDTKIDDGKPQIGSVTALESLGGAAGSGCGLGAAAATDTTVTAYDLSNTAATACALVFKTGY